MGYSARYHAASLIAVFLALAIGILIGAEFGGDALTSTRKNLEHSLAGNLQDARARADELSGELGRSDEFAGRVYPALVRDRLAGKRIASSPSAACPSDITGDVEDALGPTGARLVGVGVVREPVDLSGLAGDLAKTRFADLRTQPGRADRIRHGARPPAGASAAPCSNASAASSSPGPAATSAALDGVIVVRDQPEDMGPVQRATASRLESALMGGITATRAPAVGVETSTAEPSRSPSSSANDLSSVDDVDLTAGQVATVFALLGAEGSFGVKGTADRLLPDLLPAGRG